MCEHKWEYIYEEIHDSEGKRVGNYTMPTKRKCKKCKIVQTRVITWVDVNE